MCNESVAQRRYLAGLRRRKRGVAAARWGILAVFLLLWEALARLGVIDAFLLSSPSRMAGTLWTLARTGELWLHVGVTLWETVVGFVVGSLLGIGLAVALWWSDTLCRVLDPYLVVLNALPKLALAPVLVILFGIGFSSKVVLAFLMTVITAAISAWSGAKAVDPALSTLLFSLGARRGQVFLHLVVPSSMPWIISGLRVNIALSMAGSIVGEFIASDRGLGRMIVYAGTVFDLTLVWVGVVVLSLLSVLMYLAVVLLEKLLGRLWTSGQEAQDAA